MIPSIHKRGSKTVGLIRYLYGPGASEEHIDPHLVAAFDPLTPDPGRDPSVTYEQLERLLDQPVNALPANRRPKKHVWHISVRASPEDPVLSDEDWAVIARRTVAATGIAPDGDEQACRWAAVRHADDHIHIIATLVRDDGRRPRLHNEARRAQAEARRIEADYGLRRIAPGNGTAAKHPTSAERHKADRQGKDRAPREELRETVRRAVAGATSEKEFFDRLAAAGLLIRQRVAPSGDLLGYKVLPDDRNADNEPVFYAGSTLSPDLSLPRIRERWKGDAAQGQSSDAPADRASAPVSSGPAAARRQATTAAWQAVLVIDHGDDAQVAAQIAAAGEVLDALAKTSAAHTRRELREAAFAFERATRSHIRAERGHDRALRQAARDLVYSGPALGRGEDGATTAMLIDMAFFLVTAAAHWHGKQEHAQQAAAARQAADHLRAAYRAAAPMPMGVLYQRGRRLSQPLRHKQAAYLRQAVPELAEQILVEPGWYALAATLADAESAGHDPAALLAKAAERRELDTADSVSDVLVWRLRRMADLPADATTMPEHTTTAKGNGRATRPGSGSGDLVRLLATRANEVQGIDSDPVIISRAQRLTPPAAPVTFTVADALTGIPAGSYDVITCVAAIHHLPFTEALTVFRQRLAPGGTLVVVGLSRAQTAGDYLLGAAASPVNAATGWLKNKGRRSPRPVSMTALTRPADMSFSDIVSGAHDALPGARLRRRLFWRYTLVWHRH